MKANKKHIQAEQHNNSIKTDVQAIERTAEQTVPDNSIILKDYTNAELEEAQQSDVLCDYVSFKKDFLKQLGITDKTLFEVVATALSQTYNISNLTPEMLKRNYHLKHVASDRINGVVKVKADKTQKATIKAVFDSLAVQLTEKIKALNVPEQTAREKLSANDYISKLPYKEDLINVVCANVYSLNL